MYRGPQVPNLSFYDRFCPLRHKLVVPNDIIHWQTKSLEYIFRKTQYLINTLYLSIYMF